MDENTNELAQVVAVDPKDVTKTSKQTILDLLRDSLKQIPGYGCTIVQSKAQPILKVITPLGEAFNVTVK